MTKPPFSRFADRQRPVINKQLTAILAAHISANGDPAYQDVCQQLADLIQRGGKRLRPLLFLIAYQGYGGRSQAAARQVAAVQELLHTFLLIHDDIIDRDHSRWGGPNISGVFLARYAKIMPAAETSHLASSQALLAGDICQTLANQALLASSFEPRLLTIALQLQQAVTQQVIAGEVAEIAASRQVITPAQALAIGVRKTASYSFDLPLQLAALLAAADLSQAAALNKLARQAGIAFQLQDDLLGSFGDEAVTGKPNLGDLREGKPTLLIAVALQRASPTARRRLLGAYTNPQATPARLADARAIMVDCGAKQYVSDQAAQYLLWARQQLAATQLNATAKARLADLFDQLDNRAY